jgi:hypothetical protein
MLCVTRSSKRDWFYETLGLARPDGEVVRAMGETVCLGRFDPIAWREAKGGFGSGRDFDLKIEFLATPVGSR